MDFLKILNGMTLKQKVAQLIIGQAEGTELNCHFENYMKDYPLCGYRVNKQNIKSLEQVKLYTQSIQNAYKDMGMEFGAILASDQEGGTLSVFDNLMTEFPGNIALAATNDFNLAYLQGNTMGYELSDVGINMAFAPVADVNLQITNPVIGVRSFGDEPENVGKFCEALSLGLNSGGVAGCGKHFPGHGNTTTDSHKALPFNNVSLDELEKGELIPFKRLCDNKIDAIMVAHVIYSNVTNDNLPSTLSCKIIKEILRDKLKYDGVVISDDMEMKAIVDNYSIKEAIRMFILSGGDVAAINGTRQAVIEGYNSLLEAVKSGIITEERINESVLRILKLKYNIKNYLKHRKIEKLNGEKLSEEISKKSITLVKNERNILPLSKNSKILIIVPELINMSDADTSEGKQNNLFNFLAAIQKSSSSSNTSNYLNVEILEDIKSSSQITINSTEDWSLKEIRISLKNPPNYEEIKREAESYDIIVQCTINCAYYPWQIELMKKLQECKPVIAVALRDPYDILFMPENVSMISAYSANDINMKICSSLLFGEYDFKGVLPIKISK